MLLALTLREFLVGYRASMPDFIHNLFLNFIFLCRHNQKHTVHVILITLDEILYEYIFQDESLSTNEGGLLLL